MKNIPVQFNENNLYGPYNLCGTYFVNRTRITTERSIDS
jgi:hypothetical protein